MPSFTPGWAGLTLGLVRSSRARGSRARSGISANQPTDRAEDDLENAQARQSLATAMASAGIARSWRALRIAIWIYKAVAVLSLLAGLYGLFSAKIGDRSTIERLETLPAVIAIVKEVATAFFLWVAGDVLLILVEIKRDLERLRK